jgi:hypothetical protein
MFLASEAVRTFTAAEFLLALAHAVALVGGMIWVKAILFRRRTSAEAVNSGRRPSLAVERPRPSRASTGERRGNETKAAAPSLASAH